MRTIIREQAYEIPLAAGRYQYRRAGRPTGSYERWRFSAATGGYHFLRVDLNADAGEGGDSTLYHLTLNPAGRPERLAFRHFRRGPLLAGTLLFEPELATLAQNVAGRRVEEEISLPPAFTFWFPATAALSLPASLPPDGDHPALLLRKGETFTLEQATVTVRPRPAGRIQLMGREMETRSLVVHWVGGDRPAQQRTLWLDQAGWPLQMVRDDGLQALEISYVRYRADKKSGKV